MRTNRTERQIESSEIVEAYRMAEKAVRAVGTLLLTRRAGCYLWAAEHKTAVRGLCAILRQLERNVPRYYDDTPAEPEPAHAHDCACCINARHECNCGAE